jgi:hypothetical protein
MMLHDFNVPTASNKYPSGRATSIVPAKDHPISLNQVCKGEIDGAWPPFTT